MRPASQIARYVALEVLQYTALAFLASLPVILLPNVFDQFDDFVVVGVTAGDIRGVLGWVLVLVTGYALPIAFVLGLLLALGRLHADHEIEAMRACGLGVFALIVPMVAVGVLVSLCAGAVSIGLEHMAWKQIESIQRQILSRGAVIEPGRLQRFGKRMILARDRRDESHFEGIVISDDTVEEKPLLIFAESADYSFEPETGMLRLLLANGDIRMDRYPNDKFEEHRISFTSFEYSFRAPWLANDHWRFRPTQLSLRELRSTIARQNRGEKVLGLRYRETRYYESMLYRMFAIPTAPFLFSWIGVPLAFLGFVRSRPQGMLMALLLLGAYYAFFVFAYEAAQDGLWPPLPAIWAPNALIVAVAVVLLAYTVHQRR